MDDILVLSLPSAYSREFLFFLSFLLAAAAGFGQSIGGLYMITWHSLMLLFPCVFLAHAVVDLFCPPGKKKKKKKKKPLGQSKKIQGCT